MSGAARLRVALFGSPEFAVEVLRALADRHDVVLAVAQPDKPAGRGLAVRPPAVADAARTLGIPLAQPKKLRGHEAFRRRLADADLDVAVTAAYGKILPGALLDVPRHGFLNVHASLLPKYRGAAPVQWALICGETRTGATIMQTDEGLDTGPIRHQKALDIGPHETAAELFPRLAELGVEALLEALDLLAAGELPSRPQNDDEATHAPLLDREDGRIEWTRTAAQSYDRYRGVYVWPGTWFDQAGHAVKVREMRPAEAAGTGHAPGEVLAVAEDGVVVGCAAGALRLVTVQPASKRPMPARAWANGYGVSAGVRLA